MRITEETLRTLAAIAYYGEATAAQVRGRTGLASGTVSPILARLDEAGWLERREENGSAGRPLRVFYRIADPEAVRAKVQGLRLVLESLVEDLG